MNLWNLLHDTRQLHERLVRMSLGHVKTAGTCAFGAYLVDSAIKRWLPSMRCCVRGGDGAADGGFFDASGRGHGHYWVEVEDGTETWVADITADQFGGEPVVLLQLERSRATYRPGDADLVAEHMAVFGDWLNDASAPAPTAR